MKTRKEVMTKAHKIAKTLEGDYLARLKEALKQAWEWAKQTVKEVIEIITDGKASKSATYKQYKYLLSFDNVEIDFRSASQFFKYVNVWEASEAIDLAKQGLIVKIS